MKYDRMTAKQLAHRLSRAGEAPHPDLIDAILARREEMEPLLLDIFNVALDDDWSDPEDPRWYRFGHTGRFMIAWQTRAALPTIARLYSADDQEILDLCEWFEEDLAYYGPPAIPFLKQIVRKDSAGQWHYGKGLSGSMLTRIASYYPEVRDDIIAFLRAQLPSVENLPQNQDEMWGNWASELAELGDLSSRDEILALDEAGVLDGAFFARKDYLKRLDRGFTPQDPPSGYDISSEYRWTYKRQQERRREEVEQQRLERRRRVQAATTPKKVKIGRNDPCPCGSGLKYKKCHGRPGAR